jgi:hypothetical protein
MAMAVLVIAIVIGNWQLAMAISFFLLFLFLDAIVPAGNKEPRRRLYSWLGG